MRADAVVVLDESTRVPLGIITLPDVVRRIAIETNSLNMIVQTVGLGHLATVLPRTIAATQADLHWLPLLPELPRHTIALITHRGAYKSAASWAFEEMAEEWSNTRSPIE